MNNLYLENLIISYLEYQENIMDVNTWDYKFAPLLNEIADILFKEERSKFDIYYSGDIHKINEYILENWGTLNSVLVKKIILRNRKLNKLGI